MARRAVAQKIVYEAFETVKEKTGNDPLEMFEKAMENIMPSLEVKARRVGGSTYQVPLEVSPAPPRDPRPALADSVQPQPCEKTMSARLAAEIIDATNNVGGAVKKREDTHKMAEANKAFAHYRLLICLLRRFKPWQRRETYPCK